MGTGPRPLGVMILGGLNLIEGVWNLWIATMYLGMGIAAVFTLDSAAVGGYGVAYGILVGVVGALLLIIAGGYFYLEGWAWLYGMLVNGLNLILAVLSVVFTGSAPVIVGIVIPLIVLWYLNRPDIRAAFGR